MTAIPIVLWSSSSNPSAPDETSIGQINWVPPARSVITDHIREDDLGDRPTCRFEGGCVTSRSVATDSAENPARRRNFFECWGLHRYTLGTLAQRYPSY